MADTKNDKNFNSPALRFPGFTEPWKQYKLSDFLEFKNGLNPDAKRIGKPGIKFISVMDILNAETIKYETIRGEVKATEKEISEFSVGYGDILFQRSSETLEDIGRANVYLDQRKAVFGGFVIRGKKIADYNPLFFRYNLLSPNTRRRIIPMGAGAQHFNISQDGLKQVSLHIPINEEQQKIADLLQLLDERIATQRRLIKDLEKLKSSIIDKIFSNEDGKVVRYRDILEVSTQRNDGKADYRILSASQELGMVERNSLDIDIKAEAKSISTYKRVYPGDYVLHLRSFQGGLAFANVEGICSPAYTILRPKKRLEYGYLKEYFNSSRFIRSLVLVTYGIRDGRSINVDEFLDMNISIHSIEKQAKIVKSQTMLSDKLRLERNILYHYEQQYFYLLKRLFI